MSRHEQQGQMKSIRTRIFVVVGVVLLFLIGVLIGYFSRGDTSSNHRNTATWDRLTREPDIQIRDKLKDNIDVENLRQQLREFTKSSRLAGTPRQKETAEYVSNLWKEYGLESEVVTYNVLLSYPEQGENTTITVFYNDGSQHIIYAEEPPLGDDPGGFAVRPFNAYSPARKVQGKLVYANYARDSDFEKLVEQNIDVTGSIVIARYSKGFRGNKLKQAQDRGALGIILYSDPADYIGIPDPPVYPDTWWLPGPGVQRGNVVTVKGDQTTPGLPSTWYAHRLNDSQLRDSLPKIPCQPISYNDARILLSTLGGNVVPAEWKGALNTTYRFGPSQVRRITLDVRNVNELREIHNVIGRIPGSVEPDRQVLLGNHRDAWVYGAYDPTSGTTVLMELARIFGKLYREGWKPRRSIVFCSWDAEEYGLVGSYEWVEENLKKLTSQAVSYLNIDSAITGNYTLDVRTVPLLRNLIYDTAKVVPDPFQPTKTLFDTWLERNPETTEPTRPRVEKIGAGSDHSPFIAGAGVPATYPRMYGTGANYTSRGTPLYHTRYETFQAYTMVDPDFTVAKTMAAFVGELARSLGDSVIIPMDVEVYAKEVRDSVSHLSEIRSRFPTGAMWLDGLQSASKNFSKAAMEFHTSLKKIDRKNPILVRMMNDKIMSVERAFIYAEGLPDRPRYKHVLHSPSGMNYYGGSDFPGLEDLLYKIGTNTGRWDQVKQHISVLTYCIQTAASILQ
ncbi:hypothetical protein ScPMuIL_015867 [Solemya velum]